MSESRDITAEHARTAAQMEADVGVEHVADVYAKALLDTTERAGQTEAVIEDFDAIVAEMVGRFPSWKPFWTRYSSRRKRKRL